MNEFKVKRVKNGWVLEYMNTEKSVYMQEVYTDGNTLHERLRGLFMMPRGTGWPICGGRSSRAGER